MIKETLPEESGLVRLLDVLVLIVGIAMVIYHMVVTQFAVVNEFLHQNIHVGLALIIVLLSYMRKTRSIWSRFLGLILILLAFSVATYIWIRFEPMTIMLGFPDQPTFIVGVILILVVLIVCLQTWGPILPVISTISILYFMFGQYLPEPFYHAPFDMVYVVSSLSVGFTGIFGSMMNASANEVFLFIVFGALLEATGANQFFLEIGRGISRYLAGGPAQTAVVGSACVGMVSGSAMANVGITGAFTIPLMKRAGYRPDTAGAIEATASAGGQIMPPVMGAAAFLMAALLGIPYADVMLAGVIPAALYFASVGIGVEFIARKEGIPRLRDNVNTKLILLRGPLFFIPLLLLTVLLLMRYSAAFAAFWTIILTVSLAYLRSDTRMSLPDLARGFANGALVGAKIAVAIACVGIIAQALIATGLGIRVSGVVEAVSGGNLAVALGFTMLLSILLGIGVPTMAAYALVAVVVAPVLIRMGAEPITAHYFALYLAVYSCIIPPVAMAALAACGISGGNFWKTSIEAFRLGIAGLIIPFLVVFNPVMVLKPLDPIYSTLSLIAAPVGLLSLHVINYGFFTRQLGLIGRLWFAIAAIGFFGYSFTKEYVLFGLGVIAFLSAVWWYWWRTRKSPETHSEVSASAGVPSPN